MKLDKNSFLFGVWSNVIVWCALWWAYVVFVLVGVFMYLIFF